MNYYDRHGRLHDKIVTATDPFPSNNSFLFSGEASLLGVPVDKLKVLSCWSKCQTDYGYFRNPDCKMLPASSHDEVVGIFMLSSMFGDREKRHYEQLKEQRFQVCNLPGFVPTPWYKLNPFRVVRDYWRLSREENPRKAAHKYEYIWPIIFRHLPQHTYFYKRCAGLVPNFAHSAYNFCAALHTIYRGDNSSRTMLGFKLLKLKKLGQTWHEKLLTKLYNRKLDFAAEVGKYFPTDHPIAIAAISRGGGV